MFAHCVRETVAEHFKGENAGHSVRCAEDLANVLYRMNPVARAALEWTRQQFTAEECQRLGELPLVEEGGAAQATFVHATPHHPENWMYIVDGYDADASMARQTKDLCFYGYTHQPKVFVSRGEAIPLMKEPGEIVIESGTKYVVNVGSVGQPRDGDSRACYAVYDLESKTVSHRRVEYDIETAQEKIKAARLPEMLSRRLALEK